MEKQPEKLLSEDELHALLTTAPGSTGESVTARRKEIKPYDFRFPQIFINEHLHAIENICQEFAKTVSLTLASYLGMPAQVALNCIEEHPYAQYLGSLQSTTVITTYSVHPAGRTGTTELSTELALAVIDRMLGGEGKPGTVRPLTDIELALATKFMERVFEDFDRSWKRRISDFSTQVAPAAGTPEPVRARLLSEENDTVFVLSFEMKAGITIGKFIVSLPQGGLKPFLNMLTAKTEALAASPATLAAENLNDVRMGVSAFMNEVPITVSEFMRLGKGDIIPLMNVEDTLRIKIEEKFVLRGRLGRIRNAKSLQVTGLYTNEEEE
jgi:flagellar motor switch protein FliM